MKSDPAGTVTICRKTTFSCGVRYVRSDLSESENRRLFGSSYSEHGHGYNYVLLAYVEGPIDPETGMVINLKELDSVLAEVTEPLDHHFLNFDVPYFAEIVPTTENIAAYCYQEIARRMVWDQVRLKKVRILEGPDLWVDFE